MRIKLNENSVVEVNNLLVEIGLDETEEEIEKEVLFLSEQANYINPFAIIEGQNLVELKDNILNSVCEKGFVDLSKEKLLVV